MVTLIVKVTRIKCEIAHKGWWYHWHLAVIFSLFVGKIYLKSVKNVQVTQKFSAN